MEEDPVTEEQLAAKQQEIVGLLNAHNIPLQEWGAGDAKTVRHLAKEILEGESVLVEKNSELLRRVQFVNVDVRYTREDGAEIQLKETRQEFNDGRVRNRGYTGVNEKMKTGEDVNEATIRALKEELGIENESPIVDMGEQTRVLESLSYPGLMTFYRFFKKRTEIGIEDYNPEGFVEVQPDKKTYFEWDKVEEDVDPSAQ